MNKYGTTSGKQERSNQVLLSNSSSSKYVETAVYKSLFQNTELQIDIKRQAELYLHRSVDSPKKEPNGLSHKQEMAKEIEEI